MTFVLQTYKSQTWLEDLATSNVYDFVFKMMDFALKYENGFCV